MIHTDVHAHPPEEPPEDPEEALARDEAIAEMYDRETARGPRQCLHVGREDTQESLEARGVKPEAAEELLAMRDRLLGKRRRVMGELEPDDGLRMEASVPAEAFRERLEESEQRVRSAGDRLVRIGRKMQGKEGAEMPPSDTRETGGTG